MADTLFGSSSSFGFGGGSSSSGLAAQYKKNSMFPPNMILNHTNARTVIAAIQMGDPSHVPNLSIDVGTSTKNGVRSIFFLIFSLEGWSIDDDNRSSQDQILLATLVMDIPASLNHTVILEMSIVIREIVCRFI